MSVGSAIFRVRRPSEARNFVRFTNPTVIPVSYTHLRAHETVLDLVCRLLLEKKKNKDNDVDRR